MNNTDIFDFFKFINICLNCNHYNDASPGIYDLYCSKCKIGGFQELNYISLYASDPNNKAELSLSFDVLLKKFYLKLHLRPTNFRFVLIQKDYFDYFPEKEFKELYKVMLAKAESLYLLD